MTRRDKKVYTFQSDIEAVWRDIVDYEDPRKYEAAGQAVAMERIETISPTEFMVHYGRGYRIHYRVLERVEQELYKLESRVHGPEGAIGSATTAELRLSSGRNGGTRLELRRAMQCNLPMFIASYMRTPKDTYGQDMKRRLGELE